MSTTQEVVLLKPHNAVEESTQQFVSYVPNVEDVAIAQEVSRWTKSSNMIPRTTEDLLGFFKQGRSIVMVDDMGRVAGHVAFTKTFPDNSLEIGSLVTNPLFFRRGVAVKVVTELLAHGKKLFEDFDQRKVFALANQASLKTFIDTGFSVSSDPRDVHSDAWRECTACPLFNGEGKNCCDILLILDKPSETA